MSDVCPDVLVLRIFAEGELGLNNFEACLKFTAPDPNDHARSLTLYYPGGTRDDEGRPGVGVASPVTVIGAFERLLWVEYVDPFRPGEIPGEGRCIIREAIKNFHPERTR